MTGGMVLRLACSLSLFVASPVVAKRLCAQPASATMTVGALRAPPNGSFRTVSRRSAVADLMFLGCGPVRRFQNVVRPMAEAGGREAGLPPGCGAIGSEGVRIARIGAHYRRGCGAGGRHDASERSADAPQVLSRRCLGVRDEPPDHDTDPRHARLTASLKLEVCHGPTSSSRLIRPRSMARTVPWPATTGGHPRHPTSGPMSVQEQQVSSPMPRMGTAAAVFHTPSCGQVSRRAVILGGAAIISAHKRIPAVTPAT